MSGTVLSNAVLKKCMEMALNRNHQPQPPSLVKSPMAPYQRQQIKMDVKHEGPHSCGVPAPKVQVVKFFGNF